MSVAAVFTITQSSFCKSADVEHGGGSSGFCSGFSDCWFKALSGGMQIFVNGVNANVSSFPSVFVMRQNLFFL